jgi:hypothetical protein
VVGGRRVGEGKRVSSMWRVVYSVGAGHRVRESEYCETQGKRVNSEKPD